MGDAARRYFYGADVEGRDSKGKPTHNPTVFPVDADGVPREDSGFTRNQTWALRGALQAAEADGLIEASVIADLDKALVETESLSKSRRPFRKVIFLSKPTLAAAGGEE